MEDHLRRLIALAHAQNALLSAFQLDCACLEFERDARAKDGWSPFPQPTRVHVLVDERRTDPEEGRRFRADYRPQIIRWINGAASFAISYHTEIGDDRQTVDYPADRPLRPHTYLRPTGICHYTGENFLLCRFGRQKPVTGQIDPAESEVVRLARAILEPDRYSFRGAIEQEAARWETLGDGCRALRLEQTFMGNSRQAYWLDPERGYALLRFDETDRDGALRTVFKAEEFVQVAADFWYPAQVSSSAWSPSPSVTRPVQIKRDESPANLPLGVDASKVTRWRSISKAPFPADSPRWKFQFSGVQVGIAVSDDAFEFHPPTSAIYGTVVPGGAVAPLERARDALILEVVDSDSHQPLAGARVRSEFIGQEPRHSIADAAGRFRIPLPQEGQPVPLRVWVNAEGYVPAMAQWRKERDQPMELLGCYRMALEPTTTISGRVEDESGQPISGATLFLTAGGGYVSPGFIHCPDLREHAVRTDADGRWSCDLAPTNLTALSVRLMHPDYVSDVGVLSYENRSLQLLESLRDGSSRMVMQKGVRLSGIVRDASGKPVAGATVSQGEDRRHPNPPESHTDAQGRYVFAHVKRGGVTLTVQAENCAPGMTEITLGDEAQEADFCLEPGQSLRGRVVEEAGQPVSGVVVMAETWHGKRTLVFEVRTDAEGRFEWNEAPSEPVAFVLFRRKQFLRVELQAASEEQTIRFPAV